MKRIGDRGEKEKKKKRVTTTSDLLILMKIEAATYTYAEHSNIKFYKNPLGGT
jgi:hypothetical protein